MSSNFKKIFEESEKEEQIKEKEKQELKKKLIKEALFRDGERRKEIISVQKEIQSAIEETLEELPCKNFGRAKSLDLSFEPSPFYRNEVKMLRAPGEFDIVNSQETADNLHQKYITALADLTNKKMAAISDTSKCAQCPKDIFDRCIALSGLK